MKRRAVHLAFGGVALVCAVFTAYEAVRWRAAERVNASISAATPSAVTSALASPEARFARAIAAGRRGEMDAALREYKALSRDADDALGSAALYNAGNLYLREALESGPDGNARTLPLVELAKQSYRTLLRRDAQVWDARYNLERALWLAPEIEQSAVDTIKRNAEERVRSTLQGARGELP